MLFEKETSSMIKQRKRKRKFDENNKSTSIAMIIMMNDIYSVILSRLRFTKKNKLHVSIQSKVIYVLDLFWFLFLIKINMH